MKRVDNGREGGERVHTCLVAEVDKQDFIKAVQLWKSRSSTLWLAHSRRLLYWIYRRLSFTISTLQISCNIISIFLESSHRFANLKSVPNNLKVNSVIPKYSFFLKYEQKLFTEYFIVISTPHSGLQHTEWDYVNFSWNLQRKIQFAVREWLVVRAECRTQGWDRQVTGVANAWSEEGPFKWFVEESRWDEILVEPWLLRQ